MKIVVTGAKGQLGTDLMAELVKRGHEAIGLDVAEMDITDAQAVERVLNEIKPDAVIHCAAYVQVDLAEEKADLCRKINAQGTENVAKVCGRLGCKILYVSTDYVFDGQGTRPWEPDDERHPLNVYGETKYEGELFVEKYCEKYFTVRIAWVFGRNGKNFIGTMLNLAKTHDQLRVVGDQVGSPTYTPDLSVLLADMIGTEKYGRYHATNEGLCSWYQFACEIFDQAAQRGHEECARVKVTPVSTEEYGISKAVRPKNSRMDKSKLTENGFKLLPPWQDALKRYLMEIGY